VAKRNDKSFVISRASLEPPWKEAMRLRKVFEHTLRYHVCEENWDSQKVADLCTAFTLSYHYYEITNDMYELEAHTGEIPESLEGKGECIEVFTSQITKLAEVAMTLANLSIHITESYNISLEIH